MIAVTSYPKFDTCIYYASCTSGGQQSDTPSLTGLRSRCGQGCLPLEAAEKNPFPCLFKFLQMTNSLARGPYPSSAKPALHVSLTPSDHSQEPFSSFKDSWGSTE
jgi:hypothetical protein